MIVTTVIKFPCVAGYLRRHEAETWSCQLPQLWNRAWQSWNFVKKSFVPKMGKMGLNWVKCRFPWIHRKFCPLIFSQFGLYLKVYIDQYGTQEWERGQNAPGQSDCRIFKSTRSLKQMMRFLRIDTISCKLKSDWKILGHALSKMGLTT